MLWNGRYAESISLRVQHILPEHRYNSLKNSRWTDSFNHENRWENSAGLNPCCWASHTSCDDCCPQQSTRRGWEMQGASHVAREGLELDDCGNHSPQWTHGFDDGTFVKTTMRSHIKWALFLQLNAVHHYWGAGCWHRGLVFSFVDVFQIGVRFSASGAHLVFLTAAELKEKYLWGHQRHRLMPVRIIIQLPVFRLGNLECEVLRAAILSHLLLDHLLLWKVKGLQLHCPASSWRLCWNPALAAVAHQPLP